MLLESLRWDLKSNSNFRDLLLASFRYRCSSCKDAKIPCLAIRTRLPALQEMQRANAPSFAEHLVPGAVCWRNHWGVSWEFDWISVSCQCLFMFFYVLLSFFTIKIWVRGRICNRNLTYSGPLQPRRASYAWLVAGAQDVRSPNSLVRFLVRLMEPIRARPKMEKKATIFWEKNDHTPDWVLKTIWTEFGLIDLYKILSNTYFETPMLPPKKVISSQGVTLSFSRFATFLWSFVTTHLGKPAIRPSPRIFARLQQLQRGRKIYICLPWVE